MGALNATGHLLVAVAAGDTEALWDLCAEMCERRGLGGSPGMHGFTPGERAEHGTPRYCFHPTSAPDLEFRGDDMHDVVLQGAVWLARQLDPTDMWRRD